MVELAAPAGEGGQQIAQRRARARRDLVGLDDFRRCGGQGNALRPRPVVEQLHRRLADAAARRVDDALEGQIVGALRHHAEIGERVADLLALVEARAADDAIVQAERDEAVLEGAHLERGAHQDRHLVEHDALALELLDLLADGARLLLRVPRRGDGDARRLRVLGVCEQRLAEPPLVVADQVRGGAQDMRGRAVVALQADHLGAGKILLEAQDVVDLGPAPAIDRLVVVADAADVRLRLAPDRRARLCQQPQPQILRHVGVLVLVDQHVAEAVVIVGEHVGVGAQDGQRLQHQVAEVGGVQHLQPRLIGGVEFSAAPVGEGAPVHLGHVSGRQPAVLPVVDIAGELARRPALLVDAFRLDDLLHQADLVVGVEDGEVALQRSHLGVAAQHLGADRMEGAQPLHALDHAADQIADAVLHLARRLVGEGDGEDLPGLGAAGGQQMGDAGGEHARLAGAGAGQNQNRPLGRLHRSALLGVQLLQPRRTARPRRPRGNAARPRLRRRDPSPLRGGRTGRRPVGGVARVGRPAVDALNRVGH